MFIADWKSGALRDNHVNEAMFYALVATLRHGIPPYRSTVYSLASGTFTDPDVTAERLRAAAAQVVAGVTAIVDVLTDEDCTSSFAPASSSNAGSTGSGVHAASPMASRNGRISR